VAVTPRLGLSLAGLPKFSAVMDWARKQGQAVASLETDPGK
jgi:hypothetical protein